MENWKNSMKTIYLSELLESMLLYLCHNLPQCTNGPICGQWEPFKLAAVSF